mmetsp:Transcript_15780/g.26425  ORF Transcript_15780/g.26425 Transcript_15780/m.26425 type:complete len:177 (+) Transcript_15780:586-1116(+)
MPLSCYRPVVRMPYRALYYNSQRSTSTSLLVPSIAQKTSVILTRWSISRLVSESLQAVCCCRILTVSMPVCLGLFSIFIKMQLDSFVTPFFSALSQIDYKCKEDQPSTMIVCEDFDIHCQVLEADGRDAVIRVLELKRELKVLLETKVKNSAFVKSVANQRGDDHSWFNDYMYYHM